MSDSLAPIRTVVAAGQVWRHYKGGTYFVVAVGRHSETLEPMVCYRLTNDSANFWIRPLVMWLDDVGGRPRFERIR